MLKTHTEGVFSVFVRLADENESSKKEKGERGDKLIFDRVPLQPCCVL